MMKKLNLSLLARKSQRHVPKLKYSECVTEKNVLKSIYKDCVVPKLTVQQFVFQNLDKWPQRTALVCGITGRGYTYEQLFQMSNIFAAALRSKFRLVDGDCVAVVLPNDPDYPLILFGVNEAGCVLTTMNPLYGPYEIQRQLQESNAKLVVTFAKKVPHIKEAFTLGKFEIPIIVTKTPDEDLPPGTTLFNEIVEDKNIDKSCLKSVRTGPEDLALLPYSSGTTGLPKGVELTNRNLVANLEQQCEDDIMYGMRDGEKNDNVLLAVLPFFHIFANTVIACHKLSIGCKIVTLPSFNLEHYLKTVVKHRCTVLHIVPPIALALARHPAVKKEHLDSVWGVFNGAASISKIDADSLLSKVQRKDFKIRQGYGLTETSPVVTIQPNDDDDLTSVGPLVPNTQVRIRSENGENLGPHETGEIQIKGPQVMRGYRNNPDATKESFEDGWLRTGDSGSYDETGRLYVSDRIKELIKVKGFQVAPAELEEVIREHPSVADVAVVGVPDERSGESPRAFVVLRSKDACKSEDIMELVVKKLAPYKKLSGVQFVEEIPKSPSGKVLRRVVKEKYC